MAKVYMMEFTDKVTRKVFYKFGWTNKSDAEQRFADPSYDDFEKRAVASIWLPTEHEAKIVEAAFLSLFPKNIWLEQYLGDERTWDGFSGITEIVSLTEDQYKQAKDGFYKLKAKLNALRTP